MKKDQENLFEPPITGGTENLDDNTISLRDDVEDEASAEGEATLPTERLHDPKLVFPTEEDAKNTYHTEEFKSEPSRFSSIGNKPKLTARQAASRERSKSSAPHQQETHISYRRSKRHRRRKKHWAFKGAVTLLLGALLTVAYQHRASLEVLAVPWLKQLYRQAKHKIQAGDIGGKSGITVVDDSDTAKPPQLVLSEMECHGLMPRASRISNISELEFKAQFAIAECYYLRGDYLRSYQLLHKNKHQLQDESLILYTILLLKRRQFGTVRTLLQGRCAQPERSEHFFPCLAQALLRMLQFGHVSSVTEPSIMHQNNPYSAIAWLLQALYQGDYTASSNYVTLATSTGERSNRRAALSYVYETLMRFTYPRGSATQIKRLHDLAVQNLSDEHAAASWWVRFLAKLGTAKAKKREVLHALSSEDNFGKMYDNLDFLNLLGIESIYLGHDAALETVINRIWQYQKRTWHAEAEEAIQFLQQWKTRILVARKRSREVIKSLKDYASNYGKDYFYCFFLGVALMNVTGKSGTYKSPKALLARSLSLRDSWENNYAYAIVLLKSGQATPLAKHMHKLKRMSTSPVHKKWLFLLRAEIKISRGKHAAAIRGLRDYIAKHPHSFAAHRLLVAAYMRAHRPREASVVRKAYDRLQKRVPYYSTDEGMSSPTGPFALL